MSSPPLTSVDPSEPPAHDPGEPVRDDDESPSNAGGARYQFPREPRHDPAAPDLVWGKVVGYPRWPGQVLDPAHASRMALRRWKHGRLLVAYFGDRTFAWCAPQQLTPFLPSFEALERQSHWVVFAGAVRGAVAEAARRAEAALLCPCVPGALRHGVELQRPENSGIRKGVAIRTADASLGTSALLPGALAEYLRALAVCPLGELAVLDVAVARAQLTAYWRWKGFADLCAFELSLNVGLAEDDGVIKGSEGLPEQPADLIPPQNEKLANGTPRGMVESPTPDSMDEEIHTVEQLVWIPMDEEKLSDFMSQNLGRRTPVSPCKGEGSSKKQRDRGRSNSLVEHAERKVSGKKRKKVTVSPVGSGSKKVFANDRRVDDSSKISPPPHVGRKVSSRKRKKPKVSPSFEVRGSNKELFDSDKEMSDLMDEHVKKSPSHTPYKSFKVGEFIRRFATKMSNSSPIVKSNGAALHKSKEEEKPDNDHGSGREEPNELKSLGDAKQQNGNDTVSSHEVVVSPPEDIKYSRRHKAKPAS